MEATDQNRTYTNKLTVTSVSTECLTQGLFFWYVGIEWWDYGNILFAIKDDPCSCISLILLYPCEKKPTNKQPNFYNCQQISLPK